VISLITVTGRKLDEKGASHEAPFSLSFRLPSKGFFLSPFFGRASAKSRLISKNQR
jgi:hypothetical protein